MPDAPAPAPAPDGREELREAMAAAHLASARRRRVNWARQSDAEYDAIAEAVTAHLAARADDLRRMVEAALVPYSIGSAEAGLGMPELIQRRTDILLAAVGAKVAAAEAERAALERRVAELEPPPGCRWVAVSLELLKSATFVGPLLVKLDGDDGRVVRLTFLKPEAPDA